MTSRQAYRIFRLSFVCGWLCLSAGFVVISSPRPPDDPVLAWEGPVLVGLGAAGVGTAVAAAVLTVVLDSGGKRRPGGFDVVPGVPTRPWPRPDGEGR
ncbi:MAG TPA: hypothetical protein VF796_20835 [Humisphaera sp.]